MCSCSSLIGCVATANNVKASQLYWQSAGQYQNNIVAGSQPWACGCRLMPLAAFIPQPANEKQWLAADIESQRKPISPANESLAWRNGNGESES